MKKQIEGKTPNNEVKDKCTRNGISPFLSHVIACRTDATDLDISSILEPKITCIPHPNKLKGVDKATGRICKAITERQAILTIGDYDCDGQSGNSVLSSAIRQLFNHPESHFKAFVGHRITEGYGVTEKLCARIFTLPELPDLIITTDCGSSDEKQIKLLKDKGIDVIVTDHHEIPEEGVPESAYCTVNPKQEGCEYPDKNIAGCMVAWLVMCTVKTHLNKQGYFGEKGVPNMVTLLDYVAIGTIADAVSLLSSTNRYVIQQGLSILNRLQRPSWRAMSKLLNKQAFDSQDIGFQIGPRINARSRMNDPYAALDFLLAETDITADEYLNLLNTDNNTRRKLQNTMAEMALNLVSKHCKETHHSIVVSDESFHAGVQGIVASRLVDNFGVPAIVFSPTDTEGVYSGSARTIEKIHIRNVLQNIENTNPGLLIQFGGHHGAAGMKIKNENIVKFRAIFNQEVIRTLGSNDPLSAVLKIDTTLTDKGLLHIGSCRELQKLQPYGNGFEEPLFGDKFIVRSTNLVGIPPLHLQVEMEDEKKVKYRGIWFYAIAKEGDPLPFDKNERIRCAYSLGINDFRGQQNLQLMIKYAEA